MVGAMMETGLRMDLPPEMDCSGMPAGPKDSSGVDEKVRCPAEMNLKGLAYARTIHAENVVIGLLHTAIKRKEFVTGWHDFPTAGPTPGFANLIHP